jgi:hypothetical protein
MSYEWFFTKSPQLWFAVCNMLAGNVCIIVLAGKLAGWLVGWSSGWLVCYFVGWRET